MTANPDRHARSDTDPAPDPSGIDADDAVPSTDGASSTHDLDQRLKAFFDVAIEMPGDERADFLNRSCTDPKLRAEVESLVLAHELCEKSFSNVGTESLAEQPGQLIGNYKLLQEIGAGGFGIVWMAEQLEPVRRKVALKILKLGMDTRQVVARFEAERQALALMDHPNIAKIFDGGATERGRPYFVMELVKGVPITRYCDEAGLSIGERMRLFLAVCQAVQHAHTKGIIHRDLKPGNVLVTLHDGVPVPKVIDFGVAKATHRELTTKTLFTEFRQMLGTPEYMAPEQAELSGLDVDTRADIYSLGVLLYELLTGHKPFELEDAVYAGCEELLRRIKEEDPPKPSTRISTLGLDLAEAARTRRVHPKALQRLLRHDLDWLVMKALEKDRTRRYETASALALEVERYLNDEPVLAGPPSRAYRLRKFARRNRALVAAAGVVAGVLLAGMVGTTFGLLRAEQRRAEAETARKHEREQRELAEKRERETRQVSAFQCAMLSGIDVEAMGRAIKERFSQQVKAGLERHYVGKSPNRRPRTSQEVEAELAAFNEVANAAQAADVARKVIDEFVLAPAAESLQKQFADQPLVRADLYNAVGATYWRLGLSNAAEPHIAKAMEIYRRVLKDDHPHTLTCINNMGDVLEAQGKFAEAEPYVREALDGRRRVHGNDHPNTLASLNAMGYLLDGLGKKSEAEPYYRAALEGRRRVRGNEHEDTLVSIDNMGLLLKDLGKPAEAEAHIREALTGFRSVLGNDHPDTLTAMHNLAVFLKAMRRFTDAEPYCREALEGRRRKRGNDHPETIASISNMGDLLHYEGKLADAEPYNREAMETSRRVLGDEHVITLGAINNMGYLLMDQRKLPEAQSLFAEATRVARARLGDHPQTAALEHHYADVLRRAGRLDEAIDPARAAVERYRTHPEWPAGEAAHALEVLGEALADAGRKAEELAVRWEWIQVTRNRPGTAPIDRASTLARFAADATAAGDPAMLEHAEAALRDCLEIRQKLLPADHPQVWLRYNAMSMLGGVLVARAADPGLEVGARIARLREAERLVLEAWEKLEDDPNVPPASDTGGSCRRQAALERIVRLYDARHAAEPSEAHYGEAARWRAELETLRTASRPAGTTRQK